MEKTVYSISTKDNPYDPLVEFDKWYNFDLNHGYCSLNLLDLHMPDDTSWATEEEEQELVSQAIDEIIANDMENLYVKLTSKVNENELV